MTARPVLVSLLLLAGLGAGAVAGCGGEDKAPSRTTTTTRTIVQTVGDPQFTPTTETTANPGIDTEGQVSGIIRPFAANSPWNTPIQSSDRDPNSDKMMRLARIRVGVGGDTTRGGSQGEDVVRRKPLNDPLFINIHRWTTPVVDETNGVATSMFCRQPPLPPIEGSDNRALCGDGWSVTQLTVPAGDDPHPEFDGWYTILNRREAVGWDLWRARRGADGGSISYQFMRRWDLNGPGYLAPNRVSARGSGLPLFAGLVTPEEIAAGRIDHALAISVPAPAQRFYVQPASSTDGSGDVNSLPEGARIRLKSGITLRSIRRRPADFRCNNPLFELRRKRNRELCKNYRFPPRTNQKAAAAIITALHRYGAIVVDRAKVPTLYAKFNADWSTVLRDEDGQLVDSRGLPFRRGARRESTPLLRGNELQGIRLADFEVVRLGPKYRFPAPGSISAPPLPGGATGQQPTARRGARTSTTPQQQTFQPAGGG